MRAVPASREENDASRACEALRRHVCFGTEPVPRGFPDTASRPAGSQAVLLGNAAFALGLIHAGFGAAEGYPGTPSTEVIDTLGTTTGLIDAGWSVNEAVSVGVALGRALAGEDVVVTMKAPGLFQAADVVSSAAFYDVRPGALVLYVATDYEPSSTQNIIDARYFLASSAIPILEPEDHQRLYEMPAYAARLGRETGLPVAVVCSASLAHSEGLVRFGQRRPRARQKGRLNTAVLLPPAARRRYDTLVTRTLPAISRRLSKERVSTTEGKTEWGVIAVGAASMAVDEALASTGTAPHLLRISGVSPLPVDAVLAFRARCDGDIFVFEEGGRFVEEQLRLSGCDAVGKGECPEVTCWTPAGVLEQLARHGCVAACLSASITLPVAEIPRPPAICPGCPYRGLALVLQKLRRRGRIDIVFGDIGCSTLMLFLGVLDLNLCMGASESMRQGYVASKPEAAARTLSLIGDSGECHTGLDATRNAVYRRIPGVKVILDNRLVAMTGGQPTPTSHEQLDLVAALRGENVAASSVDAFDLTGVEEALVAALDAAAEGQFSALVLEGECLQRRPAATKQATLEIDADKCVRCGRCAVCPGIETDETGLPRFTVLCHNCGGHHNVCAQRCNHGAIVKRSGARPEPQSSPSAMPERRFARPTGRAAALPGAIRLAVRGIGGQGNLFLGRVLANVFLSAEPGAPIIKGETHGMAQLGGPVTSTFAWGDVFSPQFLPGTADVLIALEASEVLRTGFVDLLKPDGILVLNTFCAVPRTLDKDAYPSLDAIRAAVSGRCRVIEVDALGLARAAGDRRGASANVAVIGLLSTVFPFSAVPTDVWLSSLDALSKHAEQTAQNRATFEYTISKTLQQNR